MTRSRSGRIVASVLALVLAMAVAAPAAAAPVPWETIAVTVHSDQSQTIMLVAGTLSKTATPPADVELALPAGSQVQWAGEILGGSPDKDPTVTYSKTTTGGSDVYSFQLRQSPVAQIEATVPWVTFDGQKYTVGAKWTPHKDVATVTVSVRVPSDAKLVQPAEGAALKSSDQASWSYYTKSFRGVKAGQPVELAFAYTSEAAPAGTSPAAGAGGAAGAGAPQSSGSSNTVLLVLLGGVAVVIGAVALSRRRGAPAGEDDDEAAADDAV